MHSILEKIRSRINERYVIHRIDAAVEKVHRTG